MDENDGTCNSGINDLFYAYSDNLENPKKLTIEQLRSFTGLQNLSDELAQKTIDGLYKLTIITYKKFQHGNRAI